MMISPNTSTASENSFEEIIHKKEITRKLPTGFEAELQEKTLNLEDELKKKRTHVFNDVVSEVKIMMKKISLSEENIPFFSHYFLKATQNLIPKSLMIDTFLGIHTHQDLALSFLRLGTSALNADLFNTTKNVDKKILEAFATDNYYFTFQWFSHHLSDLFNDLSLLPPHHHYEETSSLYTIQGRGKMLESIISLFQIGQWSLLRMDKDDERRKNIILCAENIFKNTTFFYKYHAQRTPDWHDIIEHSGSLSNMAKNIIFIESPIGTNDLKNILFKTYTQTMKGALNRDEETFYTLKDSNEKLTMGDFHDLLKLMYFESIDFYENHLLKNYKEHYKTIEDSFLKIVNDKNEKNN